MDARCIAIFIGILTIFISTYIYSFIIGYINKNDGQAIRYKLITKIFLSSISSLMMLLLYIKIGMSLEFCIDFILMLSLILIGYIDFETKFVYEIISKPLVIFSMISFIISLILKEVTSQGVVGIAVAIAVIVLFSKANYIGKGDVEVFIAIFLVLNYVAILPMMVIILSFGLSGIGSIFLLLFKKVDLNHRKPLCPSIVLATFILLILI